jgi:hypothetical protein
LWHARGPDVVITPAVARHASAAAGWFGPAALAAVHAVLLKGVFDRHPTAIGVAEYLFLWPVAEVISLLVTPWLMTFRVKDPDSPAWLRVVLFPAAVVVAGGLSSALRFLEVTWIYFLARVPTVLFERHTRQQVQVGCLRSMLAGTVLVVLLAVFGNRPLDFPIGTVVGRDLPPHERNLGNSMAMGMLYFTAIAIADHLIHRAMKKRRGRND